MKVKPIFNFLKSETEYATISLCFLTDGRKMFPACWEVFTAAIPLFHSLFFTVLSLSLCWGPPLNSHVTIARLQF